MYIHMITILSALGVILGLSLPVLAAPPVDHMLFMNKVGAERVEKPIGYQAPAAQAIPAGAVKVFAIAKRGPGTPGQSLQALLPQEVRDTVILYLDGKIEQWWIQQDGGGPVFLMSAGTVDEARALTAQLPLVKARVLEFDFIAVGPLSPLRVLLQPPAK